MLIGHSQGGMQIIKILHVLNGEYSAAVPVWNPLTDFAEGRTAIVDPLTGRQRPVVGMKLSLCIGGRRRRRRVPAPQSMEHARPVADDSGHRRRLHRLFDCARHVGVDRTGIDATRVFEKRRPGEDPQRHARRREQPRDGAGHRATGPRPGDSGVDQRVYARSRPRRRRRTPGTTCCGRPTSGTA